MARSAKQRWRDWWKCVGRNGEKYIDANTKYGKTPAQVILRWHIQEGNVIFPKSTSPAHIADNMAIFDFALTDDEMAQIKGLDKGVRYFNMSLEDQEKNLGAFTPAD